MKSEKYARIKFQLSKTGLLGITYKTKDLLRRNKELQKDLEGLKQEAHHLVQSVLANPENQNLLRPSPPHTVTSPMVTATATTPTMVVAAPANTATLIQAPNPTENSDFNRILSGIYDFELPSVILAPVLEPYDPNLAGLATHPQPQPADPHQNNSFLSSSSSPPRKRPKMK